MSEVDEGAGDRVGSYVLTLDYGGFTTRNIDRQEFVYCSYFSVYLYVSVVFIEVVVLLFEDFVQVISVTALGTPVRHVEGDHGVQAGAVFFTGGGNEERVTHVDVSGYELSIGFEGELDGVQAERTKDTSQCSTFVVNYGVDGRYIGQVALVQCSHEVRVYRVVATRTEGLYTGPEGVLELYTSV